MRSKLILSIGVAAVFLTGSSQLFAQGSRIVGIQGGATLNRYVNEWAVLDSRWGGTAGLFFGLAPRPNTMVNLEVNWVQKGAEVVDEAEGVRFDYVEVPLTFGGGVATSDGSVSARGYVGVGIGFKVSCSSGVTAVCDNAKSTEWTLPLGLAILKGMGDKFVGIDVRYSIGLGDAVEGIDANSRTWYFRLMIGKSMGG